MTDTFEVNGHRYPLTDDTRSVLRSSDLNGTTFEDLLTEEDRAALAEVRARLDSNKE